MSACNNNQTTTSEATDPTTETSPTPAVDAPAFTDIQVDEFEVMRRDLDDVVVLDVRTQAEADNGIIEGAQVIDVRNPDFARQIADLDKDATYLVYCRSGSRSVTACNMMHEAGFKNLFNLLGGYTNWSQETKQ